MAPDFHLLALYRLLADKPRELTRLMRSFGSAKSALDRHPDLAARIDDEIKRAIERDIDWLSDDNHHLIERDDADYPACLGEIHDPPWLIFAAGDRASLRRPENRVAMVGARKASKYGLTQAGRIAEQLARQDVSIVSGLALGIDSACHEGALAGGGRTIAVLGTGCDLIYPKRNWRLAERICHQGLLISEFPLGSGIFPSRFPRRNRIIAGLCSATIVVEAALRSGSLISARLALSEGREVMAVPGQVTNPQARGCHQLLKEGALLIEGAADVLEALGLEGPGLAFGEAMPSLSPEQLALLACFDEGPLSIDMILARVDLPVEELTVNLVSLEVLGLIHSDGGRYERSFVPD